MSDGQLAFDRLKNNQSPRELRILQTVEPTNYTVIELFAGCGGMALGLENAGLKTQLLVEINQELDEQRRAEKRAVEAQKNKKQKAEKEAKLEVLYIIRNSI